MSHKGICPQTDFAPHSTLLALVLFLAACGPTGDASSAGMTSSAESAQGQGVQLEFLDRPGSSGNAPFSEAVRVGDLLFLSGKIGSVPGEGLVEGGIQAETRVILDNIRAALERHDSSMERVFKCLVILADIDDFSAMNEIYVEYFPGPKPARSAFAASELAGGALIEIECIAAMN